MNEINGLMNLASPVLNQLTSGQGIGSYSPYRVHTNELQLPSQSYAGSAFSSSLQQGLNFILSGVSQLFTAVLSMTGTSGIFQPQALPQTNINGLAGQSVAQATQTATEKPGISDFFSGLLKNLPEFLNTAMGAFGSISSIFDSGLMGKIFKIFK